MILLAFLAGFAIGCAGTWATAYFMYRLGARTAIYCLEVGLDYASNVRSKDAGERAAQADHQEREGPQAHAPEGAGAPSGGSAAETQERPSAGDGTTEETRGSGKGVLEG